jgi:hypothetical protein
VGPPAATGRGIDQENPLMRIYIITNDGYAGEKVGCSQGTDDGK